MSKIDRNYVEMAIVDLESDLFHNCHLNSLESKFESSTIQFRDPNCQSLIQTKDTRFILDICFERDDVTIELTPLDQPFCFIFNLRRAEIP